MSDDELKDIVTDITDIEEDDPHSTLQAERRRVRKILEALAHRVADAQREADATICERAMMLNDDTHEIWQHGFDTAKSALAAAIRQRKDAK